ncbi:MAG: BamA/TamA family outer membrane protein [Rikenellaceae bacterium]|nr:BamA/TamA family outer membrane protein [Rikenellaceae bacterium]MBR2050483.1 BamA/TamA family outer membrane protein [Rikenellaceae bacterium]MBR2442768.1 BamA/TamA family outer membrane protein [Rikenellaceae bacterium]MBR3800600.1 BamA/TamA family outer membrane protein [Rikenellaceae bacterium]
MKRAILVALFALVAFDLSAQNEGVLIRDNDTIKYTYTPLAATVNDTIVAPTISEVADSVVVDTVASKPRNSIFRRLIRYFEQANEDRTQEKKFDLTWVLGPSYSAVTKVSLGILASGLYRIDRTDTITQPSNVSLYANISTSGYYKVGVTGLNLMDRNRHRIKYDISFASMPIDYWGIGYAMAQAEKSSMVEKRYRIDAEYQYEMARNFFGGVALDFTHAAAKKVANPDYMLGQRDKYTATGWGLSLQYDSRDFAPNPYKGIYLSLRETYFPAALGTTETIWRTTFTGNYYQRLWKGCTLALDAYMEYNAGKEIPWSMVAQLGGGYRMRGYYLGQYRDNGMIEVQAELRQKIYNRHGIAVWVGAGNVFPNFNSFQWRQTLPNYGIGYRWEFKHRVNVRIDYGRGKHGGSVVFNVNEAF